MPITIVSAVTLGTDAGYSVSDVLTVVGGNGISPAVLGVTSLSGGGKIGTVTVLSGGLYSMSPNNPTQVMGGTGLGATFTLSSAFVPNPPGAPSPTQVQGGPLTWSGSRNKKGHRTYEVKFRVKCDPTYGPAAALQTPGLPQPGDAWNFGDDHDDWAFCLQDCKIEPEQVKNDPNLFFILTYTFSTEPDDRCQSDPVEDPLLEPYKLSGSFVRYQEEALFDRYGKPIQNSAKELIKGKYVEFDQNRPQVKIEQNVAILNMGLLAYFVDKLNDDFLWGLPPRCIKLSNVNWERKYHGSCNVYYTLHLEFDVMYETFDRFIKDEGTRCLRGQWDRTRTSGTYGQWILAAGVTGSKQSDYMQYLDWNGNLGKVDLDGRGLPTRRSGIIDRFFAYDAQIVDEGSGYSFGDELTAPPAGPSTGTYITPVVLIVTGIGAGGEITDIEIQGTGDYSVQPISPISGFTGGTGTGAIFSIAFFQPPACVVRAIVANNGGQGYGVGERVKVLGGTFTTQAELVVTEVMDLAPALGILGVCVTAQVSNPGSYTVLPNNPVSTSNVINPLGFVTGSGAKFNLTWNEVVDDRSTFKIFVQKYNEANFLLLGIPTVLQ